MKEYIKETVLGGLFFLIPLFVIFAILAKIWNKFHGIGEKLAKILGLGEIAGRVGGPIITTLLILLVCFLFGLMAKVAFATRVRDRLESYLQSIFPFYDYYRTMFESKLKNHDAPARKAVLITTPIGKKPGILIEEKA